jgi:hypothetical protein
VDEEEILRELDAQISDREVISIVSIPGCPVQVESGDLPADTVVATLLKALMSMVLDDYMDDILEDEEELDE